MGSVNIRNVDLNLLVALHALLEERSITLAARRLFVSQPAMSRIKDRLQAMFGDELLVRTTKGYEPTNRALALYTQLQRLLPELNGLFVQRELDLTTAREIFRIETTDWGGTVLIPKMVHIVMQRAPGIEIDIFPRNVGFEDLEANVVDLVLAGAIQPLQDAFATNATHLRSEVILRERLVCVVRAGHPLTKRRLTFQAFCKAKHIALTPMLGGGRISIPVDNAMKRMGRREEDLETPVRVPYFSSIGPIVESTDLIATIPQQVARRLQNPRLRILPAPSPFQDFPYYQVWHSRNDADPVHQWLRETLRGVAAGIN